MNREIFVSYTFENNGAIGNGSSCINATTSHGEEELNWDELIAFQDSCLESLRTTLPDAKNLVINNWKWLRLRDQP